VLADRAAKPRREDASSRHKAGQCAYGRERATGVDQVAPDRARACEAASLHVERATYVQVATVQAERARGLHVRSEGAAKRQRTRPDVYRAAVAESKALAAT